MRGEIEKVYHKLEEAMSDCKEINIINIHPINSIEFSLRL